MTERRGRGSSDEPREATTEERGRDDEVERTLGRFVAVGLPLTTLIVALVVGFAAGAGSALLVLAAGGLLGAVALLWASVRTLGGDAPLAEDFAALVLDGGQVDELDEEKRRLLRALKDVESEHLLGKMDDADYATIVGRYRSEAKEVMRKMEVEVAPFRAEAETLARAYLERQGLTVGGKGSTSIDMSVDAAAARLACASCGASNETDAKFCKECGATFSIERPHAPT